MKDSGESEMRIKKLKKLRAVLHCQREEILTALETDLGKSPTEGYLSEYYIVMDELDYLLKHLNRWMKPQRVPTPIVHFFSRSRIYRLPYGTVGIASPWNYPFQLAMIPAIGALAGGNRVILKTSRKTPETSKLVRELLGQVYSEEEVLVYGTEEEDRERFMKEDLDFLFFTGSTKVGRKMAKHAADLMIPAVLELGGKSPVIVTESGDPEVAAKRIVWGKLMNAGQTCVAPDYVLVPEGGEEELLHFLHQAMVHMYGEDPLNNSEYPMIIDEAAMERLTDLAEEEGIFRSGDRKGRKLMPRFFLTHRDSPFMEEEIFGPYLPILTYADRSEAEEIIGEHPDPLAFYLFTKDKEEEAYWRNRFPYGGGCINDCLTHLANVHLPFGGVGESGMGRYHGRRTFETFTRETSILKKTFFPDLSLRYPSFTVDMRKLLRK